MGAGAGVTGATQNIVGRLPQLVQLGFVAAQLQPADCVAGRGSSVRGERVGRECKEMQERRRSCKQRG